MNTKCFIPPWLKPSKEQDNKTGSFPILIRLGADAQTPFDAPGLVQGRSAPSEVWPSQQLADDGWGINVPRPFLLSLCITQIRVNKWSPHTHTQLTSPRHTALPVLIPLTGLTCLCYLVIALMLSSIELTQMEVQMHYITTSGLHHQQFPFLLYDEWVFWHTSLQF